MPEMTLDTTAFMSGQIGSKIWLCEKLEPILASRFDRHVVIWILGGWYGMTNFLLQARRNCGLSQVVSYDMNSAATVGAEMLNEAYIYQNCFRAITADVLTLDYAVDLPPDVVINTSSEHMATDWYDLIPSGTLCVIQSNNMEHDDHSNLCNSVIELQERFPMKEPIFAGSKSFFYPEWGFSRFMTIGLK